MPEIPLPPDPYTHRYFQVGDIAAVVSIGVSYSSKRNSSNEWFVCTNDASSEQANQILAIPAASEITETDWDNVTY